MNGKDSSAVGWLGLAVGGLTLLFGPGLWWKFVASASPDASPPAVKATGPRFTYEIVPVSQAEVQRREALSKPGATPAKPEPKPLDLTFQDFVTAYASLTEKDRASYLETVSGKVVNWAGYTSQVYLTDCYLYLTEKPGTASAANVSVQFDKGSRLIVASLKKTDRIQVSGPAEVRGQWVILNAKQLERLP